MRIHSYPSIYNLGHKAVEHLLDGPVIVEEKVDGSQFSMGVLEDGELHCRSKGADLHLDAPEKMFTKAIETARLLAPAMRPGWVYRGEYLAKPKHNTLAYDRVPEQHVILFDVSPGLEAYLSPEEKRAEAERLGLECVPMLYRGQVSDLTTFRELLLRQSVLGGQRVEGVVVKPEQYDIFGPDKKALLGKFVSEEFKEVHAGEFRKQNPTQGDIIQRLIERYRTPARWAKAVQHLREAGKLEDSPRDIGKLIAEVPKDVLRECGPEIQEALLEWAWSHIKRGITGGLPQWYKEELLKRQFGDR